MTKNKHLKKLLLVFGCAATLLVGSTSMCFAETGTTQVMLRAGASSVDFSVSEKISMVVTPGSGEVLVEPLSITNHMGISDLNIDSISATAAADWELVASSETALTEKQISLAVQGTDPDSGDPTTHDMSTGDYTSAGTVGWGETVQINFTGQAGSIPETAEQVASLVTTVSQ